MLKKLLLDSEGGLFVEASPQVNQAIQSASPTLQSTFRLGEAQQYEIELVMSRDYIGVRQRAFFSGPLLCYIPLSFEIKFEILYENGNQMNLTQNSIHSKKIGFKLMKEGRHFISFIIKTENYINYWVKYLGRQITQYGFHKMYRPLKKLGKGGFATVYEVERLTDKKKFAVKAFSKQNTLNSKNENDRRNLINQIKYLGKFYNHNIIKLQGVYESDNSIYIVLQLLTAGNLHSRINRQNGIFSSSEIKGFMVSLIRGLKHMHDYRIMHRDIKPENIMLRSAEGLEAVIIDFGLTIEADAEDYMFYRCGTPGFVAPEVMHLIKGEKIQPECDIFSVGVIFHILLTRRPLFKGNKLQEVYNNNRDMEFDLSHPSYSDLDPSALDLMSRMLKIDPKQRIKADEILNHHFLHSWRMANQQAEKVSSPKMTQVLLREQMYQLFQVSID